MLIVVHRPVMPGAASFPSRQNQVLQENSSAVQQQNLRYTTKVENMYLENFIVKSIRLRCSSLAGNLSFTKERSLSHLYRRFGTATSDHVSRMNSKTEKLYHDICKGERAALG